MVCKTAIFSCLLLLFVESKSRRVRNCPRLRFRDPLLGILKPCRWENARGMLCMGGSKDVFVWPNAKQSEVLSSRCGYDLPKLNSSVDLEEHGRVKREEDEGEGFTFHSSVDSKTHRNTRYNFKTMLQQFVRREWGNQKLETIDTSIKLWVENEAKLQGNTEKGIYRVMGGPASEFDRENRDPGTAVQILESALSLQKYKQNWEWLDVERIMLEIELCYATDYSTVVDQSSRFDATREGNAKFEFWYYRMSCLKTQGRIFASIVIYSDAMTFADVSETVQYWRNNPEIVHKWVNATKQRIVEFVRTELAYDYSRSTGSRCTKSSSGGVGPIDGAMMGAQIGSFFPGFGTVIGGVVGFLGGLFGFGKQEQIYCVPYDIKKNDTVKFDLVDNKIVTDVRPIHFETEVNRWLLDTKVVFQKRKITLQQREGLKTWISNAMLYEVSQQFQQFFNE